jgi:hypothetical protein
MYLLRGKDPHDRALWAYQNQNRALGNHVSLPRGSRWCRIPSDYSNNASKGGVNS